MGAYWDAYLRWKSDLTNAETQAGYADTSRELFAVMTIDSWADMATAQAHINNCLNNIINALVWLSTNPIKSDHEAKLHNRLSRILDDPPWENGVADVTWESIVAAWEAAPIEGFGLTVSMIDYMRAEVWDEPAIKYYRAR